MSINDPIADMLTRIRNAGKSKFKSVEIPGSNLKNEIAKILKNQGYIKNYKVIDDNKQGTIVVYLKYTDYQKHSIFGIERISKQSRRIYVKSRDINPVLNGLGISILSTSKGLMTDKQAKIDNIGGEILCKVW
jgi:small subunit ribosomal protein S8